LRVIKWNILDIYRNIAGFFHACDRISENGEILNAEEIEFEKSHVFDRMHVVLRDELTGSRIGRKRCPIRKWRGCVPYPRSMHARVTHAALDAPGKIDDLSRVIILVVERFQIRLKFERVLDGHGEALAAERNKLRDLITHAVRMSHSTCNITHCRARHHRAEG